MRADEGSTRITTEEIDALLQHEEFVRQISLRFTRDQQLAEDVAQQVWVAALSNPPRHHGNLRGWLSRLVRTSLADRLRSEGRRRDHEYTFSRDLPRSIDSETGARDYSALFAALAELAPVYQEVVRLRYMEGLGRSKVAERLGVSVDTVKTRHRRALEQLRSRLRERRSSQVVLFPFLEQLRRRWPTLASAASVKIAAGLGAVLLLALGWSWLAPGARPDAAPGLPVTLTGAQPERRAEIGSQEHPDRGREERAALVQPGDEASGELATPAPPGLRVRARWEDDGSPARGLDVLAELDGVPALRATTDERGEALFDAVVHGAWTIVPALGAARRVRLAREGTTVCELSVPRGLTLRGVVRVGHGRRPVGGLDLWASFPGRVDAGRRLGVASSGGDFVVEGVDPAAWLGVMQDGRFRSTKLLEARSALVGSTEVVLPVSAQLDDVASGVVTDARGAPIEAAEVRIALPPGPLTLPRADNDGRRWSRIPRRPVRTDSAGRYTLRGVPLRGVHALVASAAGHVAGQGTASQERSQLDFVLRAGSELRGRLTNETGVGVAGALVDASWPGAPEALRVRADARGEFRLDGLPPGSVQLLAHGVDPQGQPVWARSQGSPADAGPPDSLDDEPRWDAVLVRGRGISGVLVQESGAPVGGWTVALVDAAASAAPAHAHSITDAGGGFVFTGVEGGSWVAVATPPGRAHWAMARSAPVSAPAQDLRLVLESELARGAELRGRLIDGGGAPRGGVELRLSSERLVAPLITHAERSTGDFEFVALPPATYELELLADAGPALALKGPMRVSGVLDLGEIVTQPPASLRVWLHREGGEPRISAQLTLSRSDGGEFQVIRRAETIEPERGWCELGGLAAGRYRLRAAAPRMVNQTLDVDVRAGQVTQVRMGLQPGVRIKIAVDYPASVGPISGLEIDVVSPTGRSLLEVRTQADVAGGTFTRSVVLPEQTLQLEARLRSDGELVGELRETLHVSESMQDQETLVRFP